MKRTATLRAVDSTPVTPEATWLALSDEIAALEERAKRLRATRQALKPVIMKGLSSWGMTDDQVTAALGGAR